MLSPLTNRFVPVCWCVLTSLRLLHSALGGNTATRLHRDLLPCLHACLCLRGRSEWLVVDVCRADRCDWGKAGMKGCFFSRVTFPGSSWMSDPTLKEWGVWTHLCRLPLWAKHCIHPADTYLWATALKPLGNYIDAMLCSATKPGVLWRLPPTWILGRFPRT